jgi:hypothetical protein
VQDLAIERLLALEVGVLGLAAGSDGDDLTQKEEVSF